MDIENYRETLTYQEIMRQQKGWQITLSALKEEQELLKMMLEKFRNHCWVFSGCGSSYYLAQTASFLFEKISGIRSKAVPASEILVFPQIVFNLADEYLLVPMSRSGTTTEIVRAAQKARNELNIPTLAVSCDPHSTLSAESEMRLIFPFERERSVVMTGSFTTMLLSIMYLGSLVSTEKEVIDKLSQISAVSESVMHNSESLIQEIAADCSLEDFVFLGQGPFYGIANEAALKMQEMTISNALSYHSLEYRHGPMSTATEKTLITILLCRTASQYGKQLAKDLKQLGTKILVLTSDTIESIEKYVEYKVRVNAGFGDIFNPFLYMPVLQLLAFYRAIAKNINPDKPKNLSAVVELEI
jgi:glucosamine--fructose-6-phosphate aminotransferase (isomerizing)